MHSDRGIYRVGCVVRVTCSYSYHTRQRTNQLNTSTWVCWLRFPAEEGSFYEPTQEAHAFCQMLQVICNTLQPVINLQWWLRTCTSISTIDSTRIMQVLAPLAIEIGRRIILRSVSFASTWYVQSILSCLLAGTNSSRPILAHGWLIR